MSGPLILNGTTRHVVLMGGALATHQGRLIVATTDEEKAALPGKPVPLPAEWVSVTEWMADQGQRLIPRSDKGASA